MDRYSALRPAFGAVWLSFLLFASELPAEETHATADSHSTEKAHAAADSHSAEKSHAAGDSHSAAHSYHANTLGFFVGLATEDEGARENAFALGIEYEHRINERFGIGGLVERTWGDLDTWVYAIPFAYHSGPWKFYVAPGIEDGEHGSENMVRFGVEYGFHFGKWEISPQVDLDIVDRDTEVWVVGAVFARGFDLR